MSTSSPPILAPGTPDPKLRVGTLQYTKAGLFIMFSWLLWGDFCFTVFETVGGPGILSTYLQNELHVSNIQIYFIFSLIPQLIGMGVGPTLSFKSDRTRSRWGRRIPYMLFTMPFLCFFAGAIGFTPEIIEFTKAHVGNNALISPVTVSLVVVGVLVIGYSFFNDFVQNVYWYLFADVVPEAYMGRFFGLFRAVGSLASILLGIFVTPYQLTHIKWIHVGVAALYFVGFGAMCLGVKEGTYPPPDDITEKTTFWDKCRLYVKECFTHKIYILIYLAGFLSALATIMPSSGVFGLHVGKHKVTVPAHAPGTTFVATTSDGKLAISAGADHTVKIWSRGDKGQLNLLKTLDDHKVPITALTLSSDNNFAFSADESGTINVWNLATQQCTRTVSASKDPVRCLAILESERPKLPLEGNANVNPREAGASALDGKFLLAGDSHGRLHRVNLQDVQDDTKTLDAHTDSLNAIAVSTDRKIVATCSSDKTIKLWKSADWSLDQTISDSPGPVYTVCFAPSLTLPDPVPLNHFQATWRWIAKKARDAFTNETLYEIPADRRTKLIAPDGWLVYGGRDGATDKEASLISIWDIKAGKKLRSLKGHGGAITSLEFKPDLRFILSGSRDTIIRLWDPTNIGSLGQDQSLRTISGYTSAVTSVASKSDGPMIVTAADNGELHTWDVDQGVSFQRSGLKSSFFSFLAIILAFPTGMLVDKFHPLRIMIISTLLIAPVQACYFFFLHNYTSFLILDSIKIPLYMVWNAANFPLLMQLFPKSKYGQFCAANSFIRSLLLIATGFIGAKVMDWITNKSLLTDNFRYQFFWICGTYILIGIAWILVYREWKKLGGDKHYVPPETVHHEEKAAVPANV